MKPANGLVAFIAALLPSTVVGQTALENVTPIVVPVTLGAPPYGIEAIWRAFSVGDTTPDSTRSRYRGRPCEETDFFLRRALGACRPMMLTPWLQVRSALADSVLARSVMDHVDRTLSARERWDTNWYISTVVAVVVGRTGQPARVPVRYPVTSYGHRVERQAVVVAGIPRDSEALEESQFVPALPLALGVPAHALLKDRRNRWFFHPDAIRREIAFAPVRYLQRGDTMRWDTGIHSCGDIGCMVVYPPQILRLERARAQLEFSPDYDKGMVIVRVPPLAGPRDSSDSSYDSRLWSPSDGSVFLDDRGFATGDSTVAIATLRWEGQVATLRVR